MVAARFLMVPLSLAFLGSAIPGSAIPGSAAAQKAKKPEQQPQKVLTRQVRRDRGVMRAMSAALLAQLHQQYKAHRRWSYKLHADNVAALVKEGFGAQVLLSEDICMLNHLKYAGGKGYGYLLEVFVPMLRERGLTDEDIHQLLITNPARAFSRRCADAK